MREIKRKEGGGKLMMARGNKEDKEGEERGRELARGANRGGGKWKERGRMVNVRMRGKRGKGGEMRISRRK